MRFLCFTMIVVLIGCRSKADIEKEQYYNQGEVLYNQYCSNCHQKNGKGLGLLYPPLDSSDYMDNNFNEVICLIKWGKSTPTVVNGKTYLQPMAGVRTLTDLEIAEITTYIYNSWSHKRGMVTVPEVAKVIGQCEGAYSDLP